MTVVASVLSIGTVHLLTLVCVAVLAFASAGLALRRRAESEEPLAIPLPALVLAGLAAYSLLQAVPLPMRVLEILSHNAADVWARSMMPFGEHGPSWASLSLDPGASCVEALRWLTYAAVFTSAAAVSSSHGAEWGLRIVFTSAVLLALVTLVHGLTGATTVFGLYKPVVNAAVWHVAPLLNPNNLAGYLNLGALVGVGLLLAQRPWIPRWMMGVAVALLVAVELTTASRAGTGTLLGGMMAFGWIAWRVPREAGTRGATGRTIAVALAGIATIGVLFAILGGNQKLWAELFDKDLSKLTMALFARPIVRDFPLFGVGRGAFESVFPVYRVPNSASLYTYAENFVVQWAVEWGLPVTLAALAFFTWAFLPGRLGVRRSMTAAGAFCGVAALLVQNLLDLALEVPGVMIALVAVLGALFSDRHRARRNEGITVAEHLPRGRATLAFAVTLGVGVAMACLALGCGRRDVERDREDARRLIIAPTPNAPAARQELHDAMRRHPAEPFFPLLGGYLALRAHDGSPLPWLERTLERSSVNGFAHLLLAQTLDAGGAHSQALLELRLAVEDDGVLIGPTAGVATRMTRSLERLVQVAPEGTRGAAVLEAMANDVRSRPAGANDDRLALELEREALKRDQTLLAPRARLADAQLTALAHPEAPFSTWLCPEPARCRDEIVAEANAVARYEPRSFLPSAMRARLLVTDGKPEEALKTLETACGDVDDRASCMSVRVQIAASVKAPAALDAASRDFLAASCSSARGCADAATTLAGLRSSRGENGTALTLLTRAAREDDSDDARWLRVADAAAASGAHGEALSALERVARRRGGSDATINARVESERAQVANRLYLSPR